ncbi:helix-turn-helix domain-containing protein [Pseudoxanthomonas mexicana]
MSLSARPLPMSPETVQALTDLGRAIRDARLARKLRHEDLASRAGISIATLKRLERGDPTLALGRFLEVLTALSPALLADLVKTVSADPTGDALRRKAMGERSRREEF